MVKIGEKTWPPMGKASFSICIKRKHVNTLEVTFLAQFSLNLEFGQNICSLDMRVELENGSGQFNNMAAGGGGGGAVFLYLYSKKSL